MGASSSMNGLASILGISLAGLKYAAKRRAAPPARYVYAKALALNVTILKLGGAQRPKGKPKDYYKSKNLIRETLELKNLSRR